MELKIKPKDKLQGTIKVPGDKSISHRSVMLGALAEGKTEVTGFLTGEDCLNTARAFQKMGVEIEGLGSEEMVIHGVGLNGLQEPESILDLGNSGTSMRLMLGILAGQDFYAVVTGDESLSKRPMARVVEPLGDMGAEIYGRDGGNLAPLTVIGQNLTNQEYQSPVASAQVKSCILLAGLYADGTTTVIEPAKSRDHTERMLEYFGTELNIDGLEVSVIGQPKLKGQKVVVPSDISSASFFLVAALINQQAELILEDVGLNPTRAGILEVLTAMEADYELLDKRLENQEPIADIKVNSSNLQATTIGGAVIPKLIDELPILAVAATQAEGETVIKDAEELRVKETDRISAMVTELRRLGVEVEEREDGMVIPGPQSIKGGCSCRSYDDHRIAMSLAVAGLIAQEEIEITNADCIKTSFPNFVELLKDI
ncbi:3-phosphoshikimate 1-carboxyvinyltransferase [Acetohalobium arabaticum]|uniref:3-phosphoshikimate 1-carboxyvinyltransferase n=1 Tax=Acetohalobium arabaticum (strain ATCC 49924 / DSM 5501 / Z-7288) TaxID=574087 RepID=D9QPW6_ACEAZ|nr:3-phosphoshikimate 1-carboxyvinyltransferase [Acetohalobium arabaticum]ADL12557.1 3-phosphoshikimate 1-carboxyvinyltransferase [Acetohalobium arabaticum DSM 5501]